MDNLCFQIKYQEKDVNLEIESSELKLVQADSFEQEIGLYISIQSKGAKVDIWDEEDQETYQHHIKPRIHTEWLDIPTDLLKDRNFRSLETVKIDFAESGKLDDIDRLIWTEAPGALYVDNHGVFEQVKIDFKYLGQGIFNVQLKGSAEIETPFNVSANIPLEVELKAYDKSATESDILNFFNRILQPDDFNHDWRYRDDDVFFSATPKELQ
jgi:hypothetical protein